MPRKKQFELTFHEHIKDIVMSITQVIRVINQRENLRDHMPDIKLILTMLAEATTTKLHRDRDSQGFAPLKNATISFNRCQAKTTSGTLSRIWTRTNAAKFDHRPAKWVL